GEGAVGPGRPGIVLIAVECVQTHVGLLRFYTADRRALPRLKREKSELGGGQDTYRITDEEARININASTPDRIERLLLSLDLEKNVRDTIGDSIQDWRDANQQHPLNRAQNEGYYLNFPAPYSSHNTNPQPATQPRPI